MTIYPADRPPTGLVRNMGPWTKENIPVTDGSERQMGKDAFLVLLLTQLTNQDPTNPMENTEMVAQLAQFSQLEQAANMVKGIETMTGYIQAQNQFQTLTMIGKDVLAESNQFSLTDGKHDVKADVVTTETCRVTVYVVNAKGERVRTIELGLVNPGEHPLEWDGRYENGAKAEDGVYFFQVTPTALNGEILQTGVYPQVSGKITAVSFDVAGQPLIHLGHAVMSLGQVIQILESGRLTGSDSGSGAGA